MNISLDLDGEIDSLIEGFRKSPEKVSKATERALRKLSKFAERKVLQEVSRQLKVTQKLIRDLGRVRSSLQRSRNSDEYQLVIWLGIFDIPAHKLAKPKPNRRGVRTGKHFWESAFMFRPSNAPHEMVFKRKPDWYHKFQRSRTSGRMMYIGLPIEKQTIEIYQQAEAALNKAQPLLLERFAVLMQQEINYVFNVES